MKLALFSPQIFEKHLNIKFIKFCPVEAKIFHADRQAGMSKLIASDRNLANAPYKRILLCTE
jgi:hypothetical protein